MARVSRKKKNEKEASGSKVYRCGLYVRLSIENSGREENDTIENQIEITRRFAEEQKDFTIEDIYCDNGKSGTNFIREDFKRLLGDIEKGKIDCVIVKDLSRLGRNFVETGEYVERIFPKQGIRFIAVCDNYDSFVDGEAGIGIAFKNLINDYYAKDIAKKITSALEVKQKKGDYIGGNPPYGYKISKTNRHKLEIDEEVEKNVQDIFNMRIKGYSYRKIAENLNERGIKSPSKYRYEKGLIKTERFLKTKWSDKTIEIIIKNEVYIGNMVQRKTMRERYAGGRRIKTEKERQYKIENTHKAIIKKKIFERANSV